LRLLHTDFVDRKFAVEYCPSEEMVADVLTKPLAEGPFLKFRNMLMGNLT
jgi:hypothetical protein